MAFTGSSELNQLFRLNDRTIIVTGGLGGLGLDLCRTLMLAGADVFCLDLTAKPNQEDWTNDVKKQITYIPCDVSDADQVQAAFEQADTQAISPIRGLVTCAAISGRCPAIDYSIEAFSKIHAINVKGTFLCAQAAARIFHKRRVSGSIVMVASMSGTNVNQGVDTSAYNSSKAAVLQLCRSMAAEWGCNASYPPIRVNTLSPGYILTPITKPTIEDTPGLLELWTNGNMLRRLSSVEEFRSPVLFLLGDGSSFMTASDLRVDGGHCAW